MNQLQEQHQGAYRPPQASDGKPNTSSTFTDSFGKRVEAASKIAAMLLAFVYVLGLLIVNGHLMALGVADFSAIRARFVMVGALFLLFVAGLMVLPAAITAWFLIVRILMRKKGDRPARVRAGMAVGVTTATLMLIPGLLGEVAGYASASGQSWEQALKAGWNFRTAFLNFDAFGQFADLFFHARILVGTAVGGIGAAALTVALARALTSPETPPPEQPAAKPPGSRAVTRELGLAMVFSSLPLLLYGYSDDVFPNLRYNMGGGQPQIVELRLKQADSASLSTELRSPPTLSGAVASIPLALWHEDATYAYVTIARANVVSRVRLTAIPLSTLASMQYLDGFVHVRSGGSIDRATIRSDQPTIRTP